MAYKKSTNKDSSPKIICQNKNCAKMGRFQSINNFYKSRNPGMSHHPYCKECVDEMIDINNLSTIYDVLRSLDTPFIMDVWNKICKENESNYLGKYITAISRGRYSNFKWADSIFELTEEETEDVAPVVTEQLKHIPVWSDEWYGEYTPEDLKYLNEYYESLKKDFKIITRNHQDYARKIAQASLAMNKAYNEMLIKGDKESSDKYKLASSTFDSLSKSAQFSESSRSANDVSLGSFGVIFDRVEKHEWIPEYIPADNEEDVYDKLIKQFGNIERSLK